MSVDREKCLSVDMTDADDGCYSVGEFDCVGCSTGYYRTKNAYFLDTLITNSPTGIDVFVAEVFGMLAGEAVDTNKFCVSGKQENCLSYNHNGECLFCEEGYLLGKNKECFKKPNPSIDNCKFFDSDFLCLECTDMFYRQSPFDCKGVEEIGDCVKYDGKAAKSVCLVCSESFFIDKTTNLCVERVNTNIANCSLYTEEEDKCKSCENNYKVSIDGLTCEPTIDNCSTLTTTEPLTCSSCIDGYLLSDNNCIEGSITNCKVYKEDGSCEECLSNFLLRQNECVGFSLDVIQPFCLKLNTDEPESCDVCSPLSQKYVQKNFCNVRIEVIENCVTHDINDNCLECKRGFYFSDNICKPIIVSSDNCIETVNNICVKCKIGFYLDQSDNCKRLAAYITHNCEEYSTGVEINCNTCVSGSVPIVLNGLISFCGPNADISNPVDCLITNSDGSCREYVKGKSFNLTDSTVIDTDTCPYGLYKYHLTTINDEYKVSGINVCPLSDTVVNCGMYVPGLSTTNPSSIPYLCVKCKEGFKPVFSVTVSEQTIYHDLNISFDNRTNAIKECIDASTIDDKAFVSRSNFENCESYFEDTSLNPDYNTNYFACVKCKHGTTGIPIRVDSVYYIPNCRKMEQCFGDVYYSGLSTLNNQIKTTGFPTMSFDRYFSCHKCKKSTHLPVAAIVDSQLSFTTSNSVDVVVPAHHLISYRLTSDPPYQVSIDNDLSHTQTKCVSVEEIRSFDSVNTFPDNCGLVVIRAQLPKKLYSDDQTSVLCVACKPMYKPTMFVQVDYAVEQCVSINNCEESDRFNGCSKCKQGHAIEFDVTVNRPLVDCIATVDNCKYADSNGDCVVCSTGFVKSEDNKCRTVDLPHCNNDDYKENVGFVNTGLSSPHDIDFYLSSEIDIGTSGCSRCERGFGLFEKNLNNQIVCMKTTGQTSPLLQNCQKFFFDSNTVKCKECSYGYIFNESGTDCVSSVNLPNCQKAADTINCSICDDMFYLDSGNQCRRGNIANCQVYSSKTACSLCEYGFFLKSNECFKNPDPFCKSYDAASLGFNELSCVECVSGKFRIIENFNNNVCVQTSPIVPHCIAFDSVNISNCEICSDNFYLHKEKNVCLERKNISHCELFSTDSDSCSVCQNGFVSVEGSCIANPTGVFGCVDYSDQNTCTQCKSSFVLQENKCVELSASQIIPNCSIHSIEEETTTCLKCEPGFFLQDGVCLLTAISNCEEFESIEICQKCSPKYFLQNKDGLSVCVKGLVRNCYKIDSEGKGCVACKVGYYLADENTCKPVDFIIMGCEEYNSSQTCSKCVEGKFLDASKQICHSKTIFGENNPDANCNRGKKVERPICVRCKFGFYFDENEGCKKCGTGDGCLFCEPNEEGEESCLMCKPGYWMDEEGNCNVGEDKEMLEGMAAVQKK